MNVLTLHLEMRTLRRIRIEVEEMTRNDRMKVERSLLRARSIDRLSNREFFTMFRIRKRTFNILFHYLEPHLKTSRFTNAINPETKVLITLRFLAQGSYQKSVGGEFGMAMSQPSTSKVINEVIGVINEHVCPRYITFPNSDERRATKDWFEQDCNFPGIIGVVDGTHIGIYPPSKKNNEPLYVNRKGFHSINVQLIVDHQYRIISISAKFPGSAHDSHIWRMSVIREFLQNEYKARKADEWLLGDSGYPLEPWLITPYSQPSDEDQDENHFNKVHRHARSLVERVIGNLKGRWRCLCKQRMLHYVPMMASKIVNACAALHNICILENDQLLLDPDIFNDSRDHGNNDTSNVNGNEEYYNNGDVRDVPNLFNIGNARRNEIKNQLWTTFLMSSNT